MGRMHFLTLLAVIAIWPANSSAQDSRQSTIRTPELSSGVDMPRRECFAGRIIDAADAPNSLGRRAAITPSVKLEHLPSTDTFQVICDGHTEANSAGRPVAWSAVFMRLGTHDDDVQLRDAITELVTLARQL